MIIRNIPAPAYTPYRDGFLMDGQDWQQANAGDVLDLNDPIHMETDAMRYAQNIQAARDEGNYKRADELRTLYTQLGVAIEQGKDWTRARDGFTKRKGKWWFQIAGIDGVPV